MISTGAGMSCSAQCVLMLVRVKPRHTVPQPLLHVRSVAEVQPSWQVSFPMRQLPFGVAGMLLCTG